MSNGEAVAIAVIAVFLLALSMSAGHEIAQNAIESDCAKLGAVVIDNKVYDCAPRPTPKETP